MANNINIQMTEERGKVKLTKPIRYAICIFLCFLSLFPFYILMINSTLQSQIIQQGLHLLPGSNFFTNFKNVV